MTEPQTEPGPLKRNRRRGCAWAGAFLLIALVAFVAMTMELYTIQPIGALPEGVTLVAWRLPGEPAFNSPDAMCLKAQGYVSLICRLAAVGKAPLDRIIVRLPYMEWAYLLSTGGQRFE
jgi:hypothetical protein